MYALPRTPIQHASPVLNSYFEHALTTSTRILPSTRLAASNNTAFTVSSPKNTSSAVFRTHNRPGTPLYTPPICSQKSYFPTLPTVQDKPINTPHSTPFNTAFTFSSSPKLHSALFQTSSNTVIEEAEECEEMDLATSFSGLGLGLGIGNLSTKEPTVFPNNNNLSTKRRPSFAHRISNMPLPELCLPTLRRGGSNVSASSEMTTKGGGGEMSASGTAKDAMTRPSGIRWDSSILAVPHGHLRKGTPHPGKTSWIEDDETA